jgi:hypothetical protein
MTQLTPKQPIVALMTKPLSNLRDGIIAAATQLGEDGKGKDGLIGYLKMIAVKQPAQFTQLLGRLLPYELSGPNGGPVQFAQLDPAQLQALSLKELAVLEKALVAAAVQVSDGKSIAADPTPYESLLN